MDTSNLTRLTRLTGNINYVITSLNTSNFFIGIMMILLNVGSKYVLMEFSDTHEKFLSNNIVRRCLVFTIFFVATRDIYTSLILTAVFIVLVSEIGILNEKSNYCILPTSVIQNNEKEIITEETYMKCQQVVNKYNVQNKSSIVNKRQVNYNNNVNRRFNKI
jgi:hypothetical protein